MKTCLGCKYAKWDRHKDGGLHPSGGGECTYEYEIPPFPNASYLIHSPILIGGRINRKTVYRTHCPYYQETERQGE